MAKNPRKAPPNLPVLTSFNVVLSCSDWQWPMATRGKLGTCELCGWHRLDGPTAFTLRDIRLKRRGVLMFAMYDDGNDSAVSSHCASCKVDKLYATIYISQFSQNTITRQAAQTAEVSTIVQLYLLVYSCTKTN